MGLIRESCPQESSGVIATVTGLWMGLLPVECACVMRGCQLWHHHHPSHHVDQRLTRVACNLLIQLTGFTAAPLLLPRLFSTFQVSFHPDASLLQRLSSYFISKPMKSFRQMGGGAVLVILFISWFVSRNCIKLFWFSEIRSCPDVTLSASISRRLF